MKVTSLLEGRLKFQTSSELEEFRVDTLFSKEPETIAWIDSWTNVSNSIFFDIGANIGIYSLYAAAKHSHLDVFSFEPELSNFEALCRNSLLNPELSVSPFRLALSDNQTLVDLFVDDLRIGNSNSQIEFQSAQDLDEYAPLKIEKVLSHSLDYLVNFMNFPIPQYIKIDVDGHETRILQGAVSLLSNESLHSVLIEFNTPSELEDWKSIFQKYGLEIDSKFDNLEDHSDRRRQDKGSTMRNVIFSREF